MYVRGIVELVYRLGYTPTTLGVSENMKIPMKKSKLKRINQRVLMIACWFDKDVLG